MYKAQPKGHFRVPQAMVRDQGRGSPEGIKGEDQKCPGQRQRAVLSVSFLSLGLSLFSLSFSSSLSLSLASLLSPSLSPPLSLFPTPPLFLLAIASHLTLCTPRRAGCAHGGALWLGGEVQRSLALSLSLSPCRPPPSCSPSSLSPLRQSLAQSTQSIRGPGQARGASIERIGGPRCVCE